MTVCIAAMCLAGDNPVVVAAADRMITAGDIQFEPPVPKIFQLTSSIFGLTAGDASANTEILQHSLSDVRRRLTKDTSWVRVEEVADIVSLNVINYRRRVAERAFLGPLGLTYATFIERQRYMSDEWTKQMTDKIFGAESGTQIIVAGVDESGAHLWRVDGTGKTFCNNSVGFVAIGYGQWHSESQFMFAGHSAWKPFSETLLLTYVAKKRAEVAPGVGADTDMCAVTGLGQFARIGPPVITPLDAIYQDMRQSQLASAAKANHTINALIEEEIRRAVAAAQGASEQEAPPSPSPDAPEDSDQPKDGGKT